MFGVSPPLEVRGELAVTVVTAGAPEEAVVTMPRELTVIDELV
jgi:hypothetical protein